MSKSLKFSEVEVGVRCPCPWCKMDVVAIANDFFAMVGEEWGDTIVEDAELYVTCPKCNSHFEIDMKN